LKEEKFDDPSVGQYKQKQPRKQIYRILF
jgi:hypothetical protein